MKRPYQIIKKRNRKELVRFLVKNGQALLLMVELIEESRMAVDELIDVVGAGADRGGRGDVSLSQEGYRRMIVREGKVEIGDFEGLGL